MLQFFLAVENRVSDDVRDDDRIQELVRTVRDAFSTTGPHPARFPGLLRSVNTNSGRARNGAGNRTSPSTPRAPS
ncbi:hypothetical protein ACFCX0_26280 [Streptomyces sp. NPDC056352]|uniref:hypothetical protein n=1 Tax=Streptomyces sp. NPDC056352 TaxID=3345791 RepID=UPI0035DB438D